MMKKLLFFIPAYFLLCIVNAQAIYTDQDVEFFTHTSETLKKQEQQPLSALIVNAGKQWLGTPYVAHTLEKGTNEQLVVNLKELDCTTFVENTLAMTHVLKQSQPSFDAYTRALQQIRYRTDTIAGYASRLHYFSDWLYENERKGNLQVITHQIGGKPMAKQINFMSTHRSAYPALKDEQNFKQIDVVEKEINSRTHYFIPKAEVYSIEKKLKDGDIIAISTQINGLDVVHVGFAITQNKRIHLLHASLDEKKVVISAKPLAEYLLGNKNQSGIMVARATEK
jgi:hypothetical protein